MDEELKKNISSGRIWLRALYMVFFAFVLYLSAIVLTVVTAVQFLFVLITSEQNEKLTRFMRGFNAFIYQAIKFVSFNSEDKPFPFADWPDDGDARLQPGDLGASAQKEQAATEEDHVVADDVVDTEPAAASDVEVIEDYDSVSEPTNEDDDEHEAKADDGTTKI